jgi:hypothetical protein
MRHYPKRTTVNGVKAEWTDAIRAMWAQVVSMHFDGETRNVEDANYYTPRPYVDEYNRGSYDSGFVYTVGRDVFYHKMARQETPQDK